MGFSRREYWSGLPFPSPGDLLNPRIEPGSPVLQADSLPSEPPWKPIRSTSENAVVGDEVWVRNMGEEGNSAWSLSS